MAINSATISTNTWDVIYTLLNVSAITNIAQISSAYAKSYTTNASNKPFVVIHRPNITEEVISFTGKKTYMVSIDIEIVCSEEEQLKVLGDTVRNLLESGIATTRAVYLFGFKVVSDNTAYELRTNRRILHNMMTIEYYRRGDS